MVATASTMLKLGTRAPEFILPDVDGHGISLTEITGHHGTLVMFICNHCPFVIHLIDSLAKMCAEWKCLGISVVAINSNDIEQYPSDHPIEMKKFSEIHGFTFPYVFDENQSVAKSYQAACTPDFYLFDKNLSLTYRGQFDSSRPGGDQVCDGQDLRDAILAMVNDGQVASKQIPSLGCNIKWKLGNEPDYFL